jgi:hypothetical protein
MMNYSEDSRIDEFCRELALALRRITGRTPDSLPGDLAQHVGALSSPGEASEEDKDYDGIEGEEDDDDEHIIL